MRNHLRVLFLSVIVSAGLVLSGCTGSAPPFGGGGAFADPGSHGASGGAMSSSPVPVRMR
ncbi:MAG: hypothetical protein ACC662_00475 [Planctomycetota bacterium]